MDREGDLLGPESFVLLLSLVLAVVLAGGIVLGIGRMLPTAAPVARASPSRPAPTATRPPATPTPGPVTTSSPSVDPLVGALQIEVGDVAPVTEAGQVVGTVTVVAVDFRSSLARQELPAGERWLRIKLTYQATLPLAYGPGRWSAIDVNGVRHPWTGARTQTSPLGEGTLAAGKVRTGYVVVAVPQRVAVRALVLQDTEGGDMLVANLE